MPNLAVIGMQWGDEGKGKVVDLLCEGFDWVVRYQGGDNAGHTVKFADRHYALHLVPSGIVHPDKKCVLGHGMVINPEALYDEIEYLKENGVDPGGRLFVSDRAHVLLPLYAELDRAREEAAGAGKIGTTSRGIGPAYEMKAARVGLRVRDLRANDVEQRIRSLYQRLEAEWTALGKPPLGHPGPLADWCRRWGEVLAPFAVDAVEMLHAAHDRRESILFEGAQGVLLDLDLGTYPFVTSSNPAPASVGTGAGFPPTRLSGVLGVLKAYASRVGGGPFVTELESETGEFLRQRGNEYGTTTGRPRRCGWLDIPAARYACRVAGVDTIALTKLDVLDQLVEIPVCVGYRLDGKEVQGFPADVRSLERVEAVYRTVPGWRAETVGTSRFEDLPQAARDYVTMVEEGVGAPVSVISTGPRREETLFRHAPILRRLAGDRFLPAPAGAG